MLVHLTLSSLPTEYGPFKTSYNTHNDERTFNDSVSKCIDKEERLKSKKVHSEHMASHKGLRIVRPGKNAMKKKAKYRSI